MRHTQIGALWTMVMPGPSARRQGSSGGGAMTPVQIWTYCLVTIALTVLGLTWLIRVAVVPPGVMTHSRTPQHAGQFAPIHIGGLYGTVTVRALVNYYLMNPPQAPGGVRPARPPRIGGC
ncbi:MAG: hypothetical protein ACYCXG_11155 [Acidiferrobacter sp.]